MLCVSKEVGAEMQDQFLACIGAKHVAERLQLKRLRDKILNLLV
jgi:hypothetical protein